MNKKPYILKKSKIANPNLSVIIPFYNTGIYIERCLHSVLNQSLENIEIILVNDGSTDNTADYIEKYISYDSICYAEFDENQGVGDARNLGLTLSNSMSIAFLDSDDWVDLDCYKCMEASNSDLTVCNIDTEYENSSSSLKRYDYLYRNDVDAKVALKMFCHSQNLGAYLSPLLGNKIFLKKIIEEHNIQFTSNRYFEDDEFTFKYLLFCKSVTFNNQTTFHYYQRDNSIMHVFSQKHIDDFFYVFTNLRSYLKKINLFNELSNDYYSLFDKCLKTVYTSLFQTTQDIGTQKEFLLYIYKKFHEYVDLKEYLEYYDINRLKRYF